MNEAAAVGVKLGAFVFVDVGSGVTVSVGLGNAVGLDVAVALGVGVGWLNALQALSKKASRAMTMVNRIEYLSGGFASYLTIHLSQLFNSMDSIDLRLLHYCRR